MNRSIVCNVVFVVHSREMNERGTAKRWWCMSVHIKKIKWKKGRIPSIRKVRNLITARLAVKKLVTIRLSIYNNLGWRWRPNRGGLIGKMIKSEKWFLISCILGIVAGLSLYRSELLPLFFWAIALIGAFMGRKTFSKGPRWRSLCYAYYGMGLLSLLFGFILL